MNVIEAVEERLARPRDTAVILAVEEIFRYVSPGDVLDGFCALHIGVDRSDVVRRLAGQGRRAINEQMLEDFCTHLLCTTDLWSDIVEAVAAQIVEAETNSEEALQ